MTSTTTSTEKHPGLAPTLDEQITHAITDEECMTRLARALETHDDRSLHEVALLIGRLAVPIE